MKLQAKPIGDHIFAPFGQVIWAIEDEKRLGKQEAQLNLWQGIPRFYIMRLWQTEMQFQRITQHRLCTQCLGALEGKDWFLAVAAPQILGQDLQLSDICTFHIPGNCFVNLAVGTWHAGPYFLHPFVDFFNLELQDTNITDHLSIHLPEPITISPGSL